MSLKKGSFSEEESKYIHDNYMDKTHEEMGNHLNRSKSSVSSFCRTHRLTKTRTQLKLTVELVPYTSFESNLRYTLSKDDWDIVRKNTYKRYNYQCGICGKSNVVLSAHEEWDYKVTDKKNKEGIQKLTNIICLCNDCHMIKHIAFADELAGQGKLDMKKLVQHFLDVNDCSLDRFVLHYSDSLKQWEKQSEYKYKLDIDFLKTLNLDLNYYK